MNSDAGSKHLSFVNQFLLDHLSSQPNFQSPPLDSGVIKEYSKQNLAQGSVPTVFRSFRQWIAEIQFYKDSLHEIVDSGAYRGSWYPLLCILSLFLFFAFLLYWLNHHFVYIGTKVGASQLGSGSGKRRSSTSCLRGTSGAHHEDSCY